LLFQDLHSLPGLTAHENDRHYSKRMQFVESSATTIEKLFDQDLGDFRLLKQSTALPSAARHAVNTCLSHASDDVRHLRLRHF
jgi:hypothetical protein